MQSSTEELGTGSIKGLMLKLSAPAIAAQLVNLLYNLVDRMYIGHIDEIGRLALTGMGVCMPLIMVISAFAALVSMGGAPLASIYLGRGDKERAERTLGNSTTLLLLIALVLTLVFQFFAKDMLLLFGASENTLPYAMEYISIYSLGTVFVQLTLGLNAYISAQGFARTSMLTVIIGAVFNIVLDPLFIFVFHMGVRGAAIATVISQCVSMVWILKFLTGKKATLRIKMKNLKPDFSVIGPCLALGVSPFIMQATESVLFVCFNASLQKYGGDLAVGAMTVLSSMMQFVMLPLQGFTQGAQPIVSFNFGAKKPQRVRQAFRLLLVCCVVYAVTVWAAAELFPQVFVKIFNDSPDLVSYASRMMRIYMALVGALGVQIACQQTFIALGNAKTSLFLALLRKVILLIPLIYLLPNFFSDKAMAVFLAEPVADAIAVTTTALMFRARFKRSMQALECE